MAHCVILYFKRLQMLGNNTDKTKYCVFSVQYRLILAYVQIVPHKLPTLELLCT